MRLRRTRAIALALATVLASACATEAAVSAALERGNTCEIADDCVLLGDLCPFGCNIAVNAADADRLRDLVVRYQDAHGTCSLECPRSAGISCDDFQCVVEISQ